MTSRLKKQKRQQYSEIYTKYYPLIYNTVYGKINNQYDAGDICQEIFLILYEKLESIEDIRKWLFGTLKYVLLRYYERKGKNDLDIEDTFDDVSLTYVNSFNDTRIIITEAIENVQIDDEERLILDYIAFNNYSYSNVGKIMGLTKRQVGYTYNRIVKRILQYLQSKGIKDIGDLM